MRSNISDTPLSFLKLRGKVDVYFDPKVFEFILDELRKYPTEEEGGKYIGYLLKPNSLKLREIGLGVKSEVIIINDFLPSGPNAKRSSVEFMPDGEFQEGLFHEAEQIDPNIEHLGSWHSHHCNGLPVLSGGDIRGYFRTVNKINYRPDYFIASLIKYIPSTISDQGWIDHYLFMRNNNNYFLLTPSIKVIDLPSIFGSIIQHKNPLATRGKNYSQELNVKSRESEETNWYETEDGRNTLAVDKRWFKEIFGSNVIATKRDAVICIKGTDRETSLSVFYPEKASEQDLQINMEQGNVTIFRLSCNLEKRYLVYSMIKHFFHTL